MSDAKVQLYFDKDNKIRAFDPAKFERSDQLEKECGSFVSNISTFNEKVHSLVEVLEAHASRIDSQKLKVRIFLLSPVASSL
jgi:regulator of replication initiation timing